MLMKGNFPIQFVIKRKHQALRLYVQVHMHCSLLIVASFHFSLSREIETVLDLLNIYN